MDNEADWAAHGLFSPSKARLAQVQAKDWAFVDAWLAKKHSPRQVPSYERNDDTLQALLALISCNEAADESRQAVQRVHKMGIQHLKKQHAAQPEELASQILRSLNEDAALNLQTLAEIAVSVDAPTKDGLGPVLAAILRLQNGLFNTQRQETIARNELETLQEEHDKLALIIRDLSSEHLQNGSLSSEETSEWSKGAKQLRAKIAEYDERLAASKPTAQTQSILKDFRAVTQSVAKNQQHLSLLKAQVEALQRLAEDKTQAVELIRDMEAKIEVWRERK